MANSPDTCPANPFTPTQRRILEVLSDGMWHHREELKKCLYDELSRLKAVRDHISNMRKVLRPLGNDIICELANRRIGYRLVRLVGSSDE